MGAEGRPLNHDQASRARRLAELEAATPEELARHESAHCVAAYLLGRRIASVSIIGDGDSGGRALIWSLRQPQDLGEALNEIAIVLAGDVFSGWRGHALEWVETGVGVEDEGRAYAIASKLAGIADVEVRSTVEQGRAKALALIEGKEFEAAHAALCPVLLGRKVLGGEEVEAILVAAIDKPSAVAEQLAIEAETFLAEQ